VLGREILAQAGDVSLAAALAQPGDDDIQFDPPRAEVVVKPV